MAEIQGFVSTYGVEGFEHVIDPDGSIWAGYDVASQPAMAYLSADGGISLVGGAQSEAEIFSKVEALIAG